MILWWRDIILCQFIPSRQIDGDEPRRRHRPTGTSDWFGAVLDYIRMSRYPVAYCARSENLKFPLLGF